MKICLISPPTTVADRHAHYPQVPPIGVAYLAACARQAGHRVQVIDALGEALDDYHPFLRGQWINGLNIEDVVQRVDRDAALIGVSVMFSKQWPLARRLLTALKEAYPHTPLIIGGEHPTASPDHVFETSPVDYVVLGEGEETLLELAAALETSPHADVSGIEGLAYRAMRPGLRRQANGDINLALVEQVNGPAIRRSAARKRRRDLDSIPWPAWDLVPTAKYVDANRFQDGSARRVMILLGTRGCPYQCRFCSNPNMWTTSFYMRDPKDLIDEMEHYVRTYGASEFQFQDLTFVVNRRWVIQVAEEIIRRKLDVVWKLPGGTRSEAFDAELMTKLAESGCRSLCFAPESGSKFVLEAMLKKADPDRFVELGRIVRRQRIPIEMTAFIIIGSPEERLRDLLATFWFVMRLAFVGYEGVLVSRFTCYPGSDYHDRYMKKGLISYDDDYFLDLDLSLSNLKHGRSWHPRWGSTKVRWFVMLTYGLFFATYYASRPMRIVRSVVHVLRRRPTSRLELVISHAIGARLQRLASLFRRPVAAG